MTQRLLEAADNYSDQAAIRARHPDDATRPTEADAVVAAAAAAPRWLDEPEMEAWLALVDVVYRLPQALDRQLRDEAGISQLNYQMLVSSRPRRSEP